MSAGTGTAERTPRTLTEAAGILRELPHVIDAQEDVDVFPYIELAVEGVGIPPEVLTEIARANLSITETDIQGASFTVARIEQVLRR